MKRIFYILLSFASCFYSLSVYGDELIRVRLFSFESPKKIIGQNIKLRSEKEIGSQIKSLQIEKDPMGVRLEFETVDGFKSLVVTQVPVVLQGEKMEMNDTELPVSLIFVQNENKIDAVGLIPMNLYLAGVLSAEVPGSWPSEALKAQAIATRSYTMAVMRERGGFHFQLEAGILDQAYTSKINKKALEAVRETQNEILFGNRGEILKAFYHSDCGGSTVNRESVWDEEHSYVVSQDLQCRGRHPWNYFISGKEISRHIGYSVESLEMVPEINDDRVGLVIARTRSGQKIFTAQEFRQLLGFGKLKSARFKIQKNQEGYSFFGSGLGHGVGLCQWGSRDLSISGWNYKKILEHYYPQSRLGKLNSVIVSN